MCCSLNVWKQWVLLGVSIPSTGSVDMMTLSLYGHLFNYYPKCPKTFALGSNLARGT